MACLGYLKLGKLKSKAMNGGSIGKGQLNSVSSATDLIDAKLEEHQLSGSSKQCPECGHKLEGSKPDWVGLPAGVKFDPTDQELIEHLEAKVDGKSSKSHPLIDEFIPTIEGEDGICYTHPEKLPGVTRDGLSTHFFHRPSKAYTTGTRKRRKIQTECDLQGKGETRWHKTGKTRPVMVNGKQKGCKKILVLYTNFGKNRKPEKTNWVMHQYHLGQHEEERDGELVVSKIFYQTQLRQCNWAERTTTIGEGGGVSTIEPSNGRRESGSGRVSTSTSSTEHVVTTTTTNTRHRRDMDQLSASTGVLGGGGASSVVISSVSALDMQHFKASDHFGFVPFRKGFEEAGIGDASTLRDATAMSAACDDHDARRHHHHHHYPPPHVLTTTQDHPHHAMPISTFHKSRPSYPISQIIPPPSVHHASIILDEDSFHQQQTLGGGRSASELDEVIMGCSSSASANAIKQENSIDRYINYIHFV
ncbi:hypothetical protein Cgig2_024057 [Carnegiea gigantea]|uniref:NAC domain-containing protein n=1 Tax=Carnegiea gigantea TaxID=171969 RepID=A0A9Q1QJ29_9CARY|nr:hypothetical protein Cgig2_024057 [Carnegiea gigantea]